MTLQNDFEVRPRPAPPTVGDRPAGSPLPGQTATAGQTAFEPALTSIIIAQKNTWSEFTGPLIEQLHELTAAPYEIIVVDNGSHPSEQRALAVASRNAGFRLILNPVNLGWAKANNQALAAASGRYICLFNSDVEVHEPQWNHEAMRFLRRRPNCCALGLSKTCGAAFLRADGSHTGAAGGQPSITETISGATFFADRQRAGDFRFDEGYPWWFEETDLCFRWRSAGWKLMHLPLEIHHLGERTVRREMDSQSRIEYLGRRVHIDVLKRQSRDRFLKFWGHLLRDWTDPAEHARWLQAQVKPLVDVCMVTKGRAHIIRWAIESVVQQELQDWQLWIIDGDGDLQLPVKDPRIKVIGACWSNIPQARNLALQLGRADRIAWIDDDEWWAPDHLRRAVEFLQDSPGVDVVYTDMDRVSGLFTTDGFQQHELLANDWCRPFRLADLERDNFIPSGNVVGRREAFLRVGGYDEHLEVGEDYDLWLRMAWAGVAFAHLCTRQRQRRATAEYRIWGGNTILNRRQQWQRTECIIRARQSRRKLETASSGMGCRDVRTM